MKTDELKKLIEKFYNGTTSLEEEKLLRTYFNKGSVPEELADVKSYFDFTERERGQNLNEFFDRKILKEAGKTGLSRKMNRAWIYRISSVAAAVLLLVWLGVELFQPKQVYGTVTDPALAFKKTRDVLNLVSWEMNKSLKPAENTVITLDKSLQKVYKMNKIQSAQQKTEKIIQTKIMIVKKNS